MPSDCQCSACACHCKVTKFIGETKNIKTILKNLENDLSEIKNVNIDVKNKEDYINDLNLHLEKSL